MINYGLTYSVDKPKYLEITDTKVFVSSNIQLVEKEDERGETEQVYEYELVEYDKNEYLNELAQSFIEVQSLKDELQAAKIILGVDE